MPLRTRGRNLDALASPRPLRPDRSKPFSHLITGIVLRAYAAHPARRRGDTASHAAELVASRFFRPDVYPDHDRVEHWTRFSFLF